MGYRVHDDNEFLETRFIGDDPDAAVRWRPCPNAEAEIPGYELALSNALLSQRARSCVRASDSWSSWPASSQSASRMTSRAASPA